jgi:hypothetical protein
MQLRLSSGRRYLTSRREPGALGRLEEARQALERVVELAPEEAEPHFELARNERDSDR